MIRRALIIVAALLFATTAAAERTVWVEAEGIGFVSAPNDTDSARRRAVADALLNAALMGGASVHGHTVVNMTRVERDLTIVQALGRVLRHEQISAVLNGNMWQVRIKALVGDEAQTMCRAANLLHVITYRPEVRVSPNAPAFTQVVAQDVLQTLYGVLDRHPQTASLRITDRTMPRGLSDMRARRDYTVLTQGDVRLTTGDWGFIPALEIYTVADGRGQAIEMRLTLDLVSSDNQVHRQEIIRRTKLPGPTLISGLGTLTQNTRAQMVAELTSGVGAAFDELLDIQACTPLQATVTMSGNELITNLGSRQGLSRGAIAFTMDRGNSIEMLEIVQITDRYTTLRPMDPTRPASAFVGRPVQFVETGL
ncbi:hypothetical protein [Marivivens aquimaris]|uniref:hypothetical protein n=1 Tax=Marivivens aquimaris TaxID=2774876 RepID=UPI00187E0FAF|nr:hypothetical protein [Marivivens aquimaris]